ncbi:hypothetical protein BFJ72_g10097 [Fusarium proliferatum]|uniref:Uncharacterized protein n=1 Tax=Gibberella intermedia TaxID=948311 RepID=A0A420SUV8_GIBIN|nr:hypothetical protein BFJ72_g10097 [Fusarium proliferatum]
MSPSQSPSPDAAFDAWEVTIGVNPASSAYAPDMDSLETEDYPRLRDSIPDSDFLSLSCFSYNKGEVRDEKFTCMQLKEMNFLDDLKYGDIYLLFGFQMQAFIKTLLTIPSKVIPDAPILDFCSEMREVYQKLGFAPLIPPSRADDAFGGLGRRLYDSHYDIWFKLPLVGVRIEKEANSSYDLHRLRIESATKPTYLQDSKGIFYLRFEIETRQARVLYSNTIPADRKLKAVSENANNTGVRDEPFMFLTCALSSVLQKQGERAYSYFAHIREMEQYINSLKFEITEDEEKQAKKTTIKLRKSLPYLERFLQFVDCMIHIIEDTISEHKDCKDLLPIPKERYLYVEKNLQTLRSSAISFKTYQETRIRRINVCLSTISSLLSLRTDNAIKASTEAMTRLTRDNREDSCRMNEIARDTKLDSEAMITIAKLTMFYLPSTFVATLFSMGIFNFDFDNGKNGRLVMSSQWWMYIIFAIPLTLGTFYWFRAVTRSHKQAREKEDREAKQPE